MLRIGIVGAGWWAAIAHIPGIRESRGAQLVGIADNDAGRLAAVADYFGIDGRYNRHRDLLDAGVDALVVATPHTMHYGIARDALAAGVHVLVEKPLTLCAAEARDLDARARASGLQLAVGHTFHFTPAAQAARALVAEGALGEITLVSGLFASQTGDFLHGIAGEEGERSVLGGPSTATYSDPLLAGGGQGQTQGTHILELLLWTTGVRARRVCALMSTLEAKVDVVDALAYELDNGALGTLAATGALRPGQAEQQELRYYGTRGTVVHDLVTAQAAFHPAAGPARRLGTELDDPYPVQAPVRSFIDLILSGGENLIPAASAIASVELLEAAYLSAAAQGTPILISEL